VTHRYRRDVYRDGERAGGRGDQRCRAAHRIWKLIEAAARRTGAANSSPIRWPANPRRSLFDDRATRIPVVTVTDTNSLPCIDNVPGLGEIF